MFKNEAQIARENIKNPDMSLSGPFGTSGFALVTCMRAHNLYAPMHRLESNPGSTPGYEMVFVILNFVFIQLEFLFIFVLYHTEGTIIISKCRSIDFCFSLI